MNKLTLYITAVSLMLSAFSAQAVSYDSVWHLNRYNRAGTSWQLLTTNYDHFCFLSRVGAREIDTDTESATCELIRNGDFWMLTAHLGRDSDQDVFCSATCYNN